MNPNPPDPNIEKDVQRQQQKEEAEDEQQGAEEERQDEAMDQQQQEGGQNDELVEDDGGGDGYFDIPELPAGRLLVFELLSSWGDDAHIGLRTIELFAADGTRPALHEVVVENALATFGVATRHLFTATAAAVDEGSSVEDETTSTTEHGVESWLCKYTKGQGQPPVQIVVRFQSMQTLAMIRISNYAGSRVHALRGVRNLRIWLDQQCIFRGEICCAFTGGGDVDAGGDPIIGDTILFTTNDEILARIAEHDGTLSKEQQSQLAQKGEGGEEEERMMVKKEENGEDELLMGKGKDDAEQQLALLAIRQDGATTVTENSVVPRLSASNRPTTGHSSPNSSASSSAAGGRQKMEERVEEVVKQKEDEADEEQRQAEEEAEEMIVGRVFHMELLANWGSQEAIGLTGIQFLGPRFQPIDEQLASECVVRCVPAPEAGESGGNLTNLLNGHNLTYRQEEMWLMEWNSQMAAPMLSFTFSRDIQICGVSVWNYNASSELSYAGVRCARFYANGKPLSLGVILLRKAPGFVFFDFVQDVLFDRCPLLRPSSNRPQTRSIAAFIYQIRLLSSWGDEFYIGLNGIELYGRSSSNGSATVPLRLRPQNLAAFPESVNCLSTVRGDPRTSDKLIDGTNDTTKAHHMWLTPILPNSCARIFVIFDAPTFVTRIKIYNYRKTPERGARHIAISADDLLLCSGAEVPMSSAHETGTLDVALRDAD